MKMNALAKILMLSTVLTQAQVLAQSDRLKTYSVTLPSSGAKMKFSCRGGLGSEECVQKQAEATQAVRQGSTASSLGMHKVREAAAEVGSYIGGKSRDVKDSVVEGAQAGVQKTSDLAVRTYQSGKEASSDAIDAGKEMGRGALDASGEFIGDAWEGTKEVGSSVLERGKELGSTGLERGKELGSAGLERGKELAAAGLERGKELGAAGLEKGKELGEAGLDKGRELGTRALEASASGFHAVGNFFSNRKEISENRMCNKKIEKYNREFYDQNEKSAEQRIGYEVKLGHIKKRLEEDKLAEKCAPEFESAVLGYQLECMNKDGFECRKEETHIFNGLARNAEGKYGYWVNEERRDAEEVLQSLGGSSQGR